MKKNIKAQIQLGESIFVVIIVILMIVFGLVFFSEAESESIATESRAFDELEVIAATQYASSLTELHCTLQEVELSTCFDELKLSSFIELANLNSSRDFASQFYFSQLGNAKITITKIYPETETVIGENSFKSWEIYKNTPPFDGDEDLLPRRLTNLPVSLYHPIEQTYGFGILTLTIYT
jgi:hypothetical protein